RMTRASMPLLRRASGERLLINIAPAGGFVSSDGMFPYASSRVAFEGLAEAVAEQVRGTSIHVVNVTPKLERGTLAEACPDKPLYQLRRVDEEYTAGRVVTLIDAARGLDKRRAAPGRGRAS